MFPWATAPTLPDVLPVLHYHMFNDPKEKFVYDHLNTTGSSRIVSPFRLQLSMVHSIVSAGSDTHLKTFLMDVVDNILTEAYIFSNNVTLFVNFKHLVARHAYFLT